WALSRKNRPLPVMERENILRFAMVTPAFLACLFDYSIAQTYENVNSIQLIKQNIPPMFRCGTKIVPPLCKRRDLAGFGGVWQELAGYTGDYRSVKTLCFA
ncbi:MAG: hypothetical protein PUK18_03105, partial [Firmicutes bacterium]|nr:hypothetical protein [Bacillota bacterium]MDY6160136.1 hypothetical protein [Candidatus Faecousia sp.]